MKFIVYTAESAPAAAREDLKAAERAFGFLPNLLGVLAGAPIALRAYIELTKLLERASLSPVEQQVMMLAASHENACEYCMAAHSTVASMVGMRMRQPVLRALRSGSTIPDAKLEALRSFVTEVVRSRGRVCDRRIEEFLAAGYTQQNVLEVVFAVAMKTLSNYANHIAEIPVDTQFLPQAWSTQSSSAACDTTGIERPATRRVP
jgi:AhpD family alkylhydroperoxidase